MVPDWNHFAVSGLDKVLALRVAITLPCYAGDVSEARDQVELAWRAEYGEGVPHRVLIDVTVERPSYKRVLVLEARAIT